jgi:CelD/BcsL family acetyltransferase involved in cellulose biosynthesis
MIRRRRLDLLTLKINGQPAACLLQFPSPTGPMLYNCGFDVAQKEWSPGVVAVALAIQQAIAQGAGEYDLLRGREGYKYKLGGVDRAVYKVMLHKK